MRSHKIPLLLVAILMLSICISIETRADGLPAAIEVPWPQDLESTRKERAFFEELLVRLGEPVALEAGASSVRPPREQELHDFLTAAADGRPLHELTEEQLVLHGRQVAAELETLRQTGKAVFELSRSLSRPWAEDRVEVDVGRRWLDVAARRGLDSLELIGRSWVRLLSEQELADADTAEARARALESPQGQLLLRAWRELSTRPELATVADQLPTDSALRRDVLRIRSADTELNQLEAIQQLAATYAASTAETLRAILTQAQRRQVADLCRQQGLLAVATCPERLVALAEAWDEVLELGGDAHGEVAADEQLIVFLSWLKSESFRLRRLLLETTEWVLADGAPLRLDGQALDDVLRELHRRLQALGPMTHDELIRRLARSEERRQQAVQQWLLPQETPEEEPATDDSESLASRLAEAFGLSHSEDLTAERLDRLLVEAKLAWKTRVLLEALWTGVATELEIAQTTLRFYGLARQLKTVDSGLEVDLALVLEAREEGQSVWRRDTGFVASGVVMALPEASLRADSKIEDLLADLGREMTARIRSSDWQATDAVADFARAMGWPSELDVGAGQLTSERDFRFAAFDRCLFLWTAQDPGAGGPKDGCEAIPLHHAMASSAVADTLLDFGAAAVAEHADEVLAALSESGIQTESPTPTVAELLAVAAIRITGGAIEWSVHLRRFDARLDSQLQIVMAPGDAAPRVSLQEGPMARIARVLGTASPLRASAVTMGQDGSVLEADLTLAEGDRSLLFLGRSTFRNGRLEPWQSVAFDPLEIGGGFRLDLGDARFEHSPETGSLRTLGVSLAGPGISGPSALLDLEVRRQGQELVWHPADDASRDWLASVARRWLGILGLLPPELSLEAAVLTDRGLVPRFQDSADPQAAACARALSAPLSATWWASLPERLADLEACDASAASLESDLANFHDFLDQGRPAAGSGPLGSLDRGARGRTRFQCRGLDRGSYQSCVVELRFPHLECAGGQRPQVTFVADLEPRVKLAKSCVQDWLEPVVGALAADLAPSVSYSPERHRLQIGLWHGDPEDARADFEVALDGRVFFPQPSLQRLREQVRAHRLERVEQARRSLPAEVGNDLNAAVEARVRAAGWVIRSQRRLPPPRLGAAVDVCYAMSEAGPSALCFDGVEVDLSENPLRFDRARIPDRPAFEAALRSLLGPDGDDHTLQLSLREVRYGPDSVELVLTLSLALDLLAEPIVADFEIDLGRGRFKLDGEALMRRALAALKTAVARIEYDGGAWKLKLSRLDLDGDHLVLNGTLRIATEAIELPVAFILTVPVLRSGAVVFETRRPPSGQVIDKVAGGLLKDLGIQLFDRMTLRFEQAEVVQNPHGGLPKGLKIRGTATIFGLDVRLPDINIDASGVRFGEPPRLFVKLDGTYEVDDWQLSNVWIALDPPLLRLRTELRPKDLSWLIHLRALVTVDLETPQLWRVDGDLVLLDFFHLADVRGEIDLGAQQYRAWIQFGGPFSKIVDFLIFLHIDELADRIFGRGDLRVFGLSVSGVEVKVDNATGRFLAHFEAGISPFPKANLEFSMARGGRHPKLRAWSELKLLGLRLAGAEVVVRPRTAAFKARVLGIAIGVVVPSYEGFDDLLKRLLARLLSPDLENLDKAILAILSGNFTVNPFADFGPGDGGVMDGGDGEADSEGTAGDNVEDGEGDGDASSGSYEEAAAAAPADPNASDADPSPDPGAGKVKPKPIGEAGTIESLGNPEGNARLVFRPAETPEHYQLVVQQGEEEQLSALVPASVGAHVQIHGEPGRPAGQTLLWGWLGPQGEEAAEGYFVQAVKRTDGEALIYAFAGRQEGRMARVLARSLQQLVKPKDDPADRLAELASATNTRPESRVTRLWLADLPYAARAPLGTAGPELDIVENAFLVQGQSAKNQSDEARQVTALCVKYRNEAFYTVYVTEDHPPERTRIVLIRDLYLLDHREQKQQLIALLVALFDQDERVATLSRLEGEPLLAVLANELRQFRNERFERVTQLEAEQKLPGEPGRGARLEQVEATLGEHQEERQREELRQHSEAAAADFEVLFQQGTVPVHCRIEEHEPGLVLRCDPFEDNLLVLERAIDGVTLFRRPDPAANSWQSAGNFTLMEPGLPALGHRVGGHLYWHVKSASEEPVAGRLALAAAALDGGGLAALGRAHPSLLGRLLVETARDTAATGTELGVREVVWHAVRLDAVENLPAGLAVWRDGQPPRLYTPLPEGGASSVRVWHLGGLAEDAQARHLASSLAYHLALGQSSWGAVIPVDDRHLVLSDSGLWWLNGRGELVRLGELVRDGELAESVRRDGLGPGLSAALQRFLADERTERYLTALAADSDVAPLKLRALSLEGQGIDAVRVRFPEDQEGTTVIFSRPDALGVEP